MLESMKDVDVFNDVCGVSNFLLLTLLVEFLVDIG